MSSIDDNRDDYGMNGGSPDGGDEYGDSPGQAKGSYFSRHCRGELPLAKSFWLNFVLLSIGLFFTFTISAALISGADTFESGYAAGEIAGQIWLVVFGFLAIGTWLSAFNHAREHGVFSWGALAMIVTAVPILSAGMFLFRIVSAIVGI